MKTKQSFLIVAIGSLICSAALLWCLFIIFKSPQSMNEEEIISLVSLLCGFCQRFLCLSVIAGAVTDLLLHKKAQ